MDDKFKIPIIDLLWTGVTIKGGYWVTGQLLKEYDDYYICSTTYPKYYDDENYAPMMGRWHKVFPSTLKKLRKEDIQVFNSEEEEQEYVQKMRENPELFIKPIPDDIKDLVLDEVEYDGSFTI